MENNKTLYLHGVCNKLLLVMQLAFLVAAFMTRETKDFLWGVGFGISHLSREIWHILPFRTLLDHGCLLDRYAVGDQSGCFFKFFGRASVSVSAFIARVYLANSQII